MKLTLSTQSPEGPVTLERVETNPDALANLKRKGWVEVVEAPAPPPESLVPQEVPFWAFRAVLELAGLTPTVSTLIEGIPGEAGVVARNQWEFATIAERQNPTILSLANALGLPESQVDAYFTQAAALASQA